MHTTVAPRRRFYPYYRLLAWLDQTVGRPGLIGMYSVAGLVLYGMGFVLDAYKHRRNLPVPISTQSSLTDMAYDMMTFVFHWLGAFLLAAAAVGLLIQLPSWCARRTGKIVRIHLAVMQMWLFQLQQRGLDSQESRATRWLVRSMPERFIDANELWVEGNQKSEPDNDQWLCDILDRYAREYKPRPVFD